MTFKHNAVPSITWRKISLWRLMGISWVEKANLQRPHSGWPTYITVTKVRTGEEIREPEPEVEKGVASYNSARKTRGGTTLPWSDRQDLQVINWTELNTHTQGLQAVEHKHFNGLKWDFLLRDYLQFKAHFFMCPTHDPSGDIKLRSYVNISSKDQKKFQVFSQGNQRDNWYERANGGREILGRKLEWGTKATSKWERESKRLQQTLGGGPERMLALALSMWLLFVVLFFFSQATLIILLQNQSKSYCIKKSSLTCWV